VNDSFYSFCGSEAVRDDGRRIELVSPVDLLVTGVIVEASPQVVDRLVSVAADAYRANRRSTRLDRSQWLEKAAALIEAEAGSIVDLIIRDVGKPKKAAAFEVARSVQFIRGCAAAILQVQGETLALDSVKNGARHFGYTQHVPYGVVAAVTPFNAPSNLLVQKVAPAIAAGNAVVAKPHLAGTRTALRLAEIFVRAGVPEGLFGVLAGDREPAAQLVAHAQVSAVTFTGGTAAGHALARAAGARKMLAELGSNAANVVMADADLDVAAKKIAAAAFEASGQQCISAQRVLVADEVYEPFVERFVAAAAGMKLGHPSDPDVDLGPMVSLAAARRVEAMLEDARARGAEILLAGERRDCYVAPVIVASAPREALVWTDEAFGPIAVVERFDTVDRALALANDSPFGLQGAVFTNSLDTAFRFSEEFEVGSLWINEASRFRLDMYPFGGVKASGYGREGIRYAIEEMSQLCFVGVNLE